MFDPLRQHHDTPIISVPYAMAPVAMEPAPLFNCHRFWAKVDRRGDDECWHWTGAKNKQGYGRVKFGGKVECAHRVAYELCNDPIPEAVNGRRHWVVMHTCDNPTCVNPRHLKLGNYRDNAADMIAKSRAPARGLRPHNQERAAFIINDPRPLRKLCAETGIPLSTAARIRRAAGRKPAPTPDPPQARTSGDSP